MTPAFMSPTWYLRKDQIHQNPRTRNSTHARLGPRHRAGRPLQPPPLPPDRPGRGGGGRPGPPPARPPPGEPLPGSRTLAATLRIHRNTALAAYRELEAEGWIVT